MALRLQLGSNNRLVTCCARVRYRRLESLQQIFGGVMKTRDFEEYARHQLVINLSVLVVIISCTASIVVMLKSVV